MFAELVWPSGLDVDRDDVEDAIVSALGDAVEVTGAGSGLGANNLDLEVVGDSKAHAATIAGVIRDLGIVGATLRFEGETPQLL